MVNCTGKPSYHREDGMLVFNVKGVCQGYDHDCRDCIAPDDPTKTCKPTPFMTSDIHFSVK